MKKTDKPSEHFVGAILRAYDKAVDKRGIDPTPSSLWDFIVMECWQTPGGFTAMFEWDTSKAQNINRIKTIMECIDRGFVPGLYLAGGSHGQKVVKSTEIEL